MGVSQILERADVYRLWQAPFRAAKLKPLYRERALLGVRRVLDVGCGPGTNAAAFADYDYVGFDYNPRYIEFARRRYKGEFHVADAREFTGQNQQPFDFIFVNSLLHHLSDEDTVELLTRLRPLLTDDGKIHILDLVLPEEPSIARWLARHDRGDFPRPVERWDEIFSGIFTKQHFERYSLKMAGVDLWKMVYFRGTR